MALLAALIYVLSILSYWRFHDDYKGALCNSMYQCIVINIDQRNSVDDLESVIVLRLLEFDQFHLTISTFTQAALGAFYEFEI